MVSSDGSKPQVSCVAVVRGRGPPLWPSIGGVVDIHFPPPPPYTSQARIVIQDQAAREQRRSATRYPLRESYSGDDSGTVCRRGEGLGGGGEGFFGGGEQRWDCGHGGVLFLVGERVGLLAVTFFS